VSWNPITPSVNPFTVPVGTFIPFEGGYLGGLVAENEDGVPTYALILAPKEVGEILVNFSPTFDQGLVPSNLSPIDGQLNTQLLIDNYGSPALPALYCNNLVHAGFDDWYMPSIYELEIIYYGLGPVDPEPYRDFWFIKGDIIGEPTAGQQKFNLYYGEIGPNPYAVPSRANIPYTLTVPGQTTADLFEQGGAQAFVFPPDNSTRESFSYWSSGGAAQDAGWTTPSYLSFADGYVNVYSYGLRTIGQYVRAVRKVDVSRYSWGTVNDSQAAIWTPVSDSQTNTWVPVN
jgi:hypothetical protein